MAFALVQVSHNRINFTHHVQQSDEHRISVVVSHKPQPIIQTHEPDHFLIELHEKIAFDDSRVDYLLNQQMRARAYFDSHILFVGQEL